MEPYFIHYSSGRNGTWIYLRENNAFAFRRTKLLDCEKESFLTLEKCRIIYEDRGLSSMEANQNLAYLALLQKFIIFILKIQLKLDSDENLRSI
jgi:hypothetical protein